MRHEIRTSSVYEEDFYRWATDQARLLRDRQLSSADLDNIAEELETLGRSELSALRSSLRLIVLHMLKLIHQPDRASRSWRNTIARERINFETILEENPSLKGKQAAIFDKAYKDARRLAIAETGLDQALFPDTHEVSLDQVRDETFMPPPARWPDGAESPTSAPNEDPD